MLCLLFSRCVCDSCLTATAAAIIITGAERFSATAGYAHTLAFAGDLIDTTPRWRERLTVAGTVGDAAGSADSAGAASFPPSSPASAGTGAAAGSASVPAAATAASPGDAQVAYDPHLLLKCIVAIDAVPWYHVPPPQLVAAQLTQRAIDRELTKALAGFAAAGPECSAALFPRIATGRWGCGAFRGDDNVSRWRASIGNWHHDYIKSSFVSMASCMHALAPSSFACRSKRSFSGLLRRFQGGQPWTSTHFQARCWMRI